MFKLFLLFILAQSISAHGNWHRHHSCPWKHGHNHGHNRDFERVAWDVVNMDRKVQDACKTSEKHLTEKFLSTFYKLYVYLPEFAVENITVKRKHRVLFVSAEKEGVTPFNEVKVLSEHLNYSEGAWDLQNGELSIMFTYRVPLGTARTVDCNAPIDETEVVVQKTIAMNPRFGEDDVEVTEVPLSEQTV